MIENGFLLEPVTCKPSEFRCNDAQCIDSRWRCDEDFDCSDQSDEMNCLAVSNCSNDNEWKCKTGGQCIDNRWRCDGDFDCSDQSDEVNCPSNYSINCADDEWKCKTGDQCIHMSWMCDCEQDCVDGSDEHSCMGILV